MAKRGALGWATRALRFRLLGLALTVFQTPRVPVSIERLHATAIATFLCTSHTYIWIGCSPQPCRHERHLRRQAAYLSTQSTARIAFMGSSMRLMRQLILYRGLHHGPVLRYEMTRQSS